MLKVVDITDFKEVSKMKKYIHIEILNGNKWEDVIFYDRSLRLWTVLSYRNDKQLHDAEYFNNKTELS